MKKTLILFLFVTILSCSKERLVSPTADASTVFVSEYPQNWKKQVQSATLNSETDFPFVTSAGNEIVIYDNTLIDKETKAATTFPIRLEVVELLSIKDIILEGMSTTSNGKLLSTDGQILVEAYKDNAQLMLKTDNRFYVKMKGISKTADSEMRVFLLDESSPEINWLFANTECSNNGCQNILIEDNRYAMFPSKLGWINIDKFAEYGQTVTLDFRSEANLSKVHLFLYFPDIKSIMSVSNAVANRVPIGSKAKVIAFGITEENEIYSTFQDFVVSGDQTEINVVLIKSSEERFMRELDKL